MPEEIWESLSRRTIVSLRVPTQTQAPPLFFVFVLSPPLSRICSFSIVRFFARGFLQSLNLLFFGFFPVVFAQCGPTSLRFCPPFCGEGTVSVSPRVISFGSPSLSNHLCLCVLKFPTPPSPSPCPPSNPVYFLSFRRWRSSCRWRNATRCVNSSLEVFRKSPQPTEFYFPHPRNYSRRFLPASVEGHFRSPPLHPERAPVLLCVLVPTIFLVFPFPPVLLSVSIPQIFSNPLSAFPIGRGRRFPAKFLFPSKPFKFFCLGAFFLNSSPPSCVFFFFCLPLSRTHQLARFV